MSVQDYLVNQELKAMNHVAEIAINKVLPTMLDVCKGMATWLCGQNDSKQTGQQTLKQLTQHGDKLSETPLDSENMKAFTHVARKNGVSFAVTKDETKTPPHHTVFVKAKDAASISTAFKEFTGKALNSAKSKETPFKEKLTQAKARAKEATTEKDVKREGGAR